MLLIHCGVDYMPEPDIVIRNETKLVEVNEAGFVLSSIEFSYSVRIDIVDVMS